MEISEKELHELSESMREVGMIHPIVLTEKDGKYEVVAGHRRWLAAQKLEWKEIRAEVRKLSATEIALIRANENLQREGLSPLEEGAVYKNLIDVAGYNIEMIARKTGKAPTTIRARIDLLHFDEELQKAVHARQLKPYVARELNKIKDKKQLYVYMEAAISNGATANVVKTWVEDYRKMLRSNPAESEVPSPSQEEIREERYYTACGCCTEPVEYKNMKVLNMCPECYKLMMGVIEQGYFKKEGG